MPFNGLYFKSTALKSCRKKMEVEVMQKKCLKNVVFLTIALCFLAVAGVQAELITIPLVNPGAETGDMTGWDSAEFEAQADDGWTSHHSGDYHFEVSDSNDIDSLLHGYSITMTQRVDLSAYAGRIEDIKVYAFANTDGGYAYGSAIGGYELNASVGHYDYDSNGHFISGLSYLDETDGWVEIGGGSTWASNFNEHKDEIYSIDVMLEYELVSMSNPGEPWPSYLEWDGQSPQFLAFDDARLEIEVSPVPLPPALLLFGSGIGALVLRRRSS